VHSTLFLFLLLGGKQRANREKLAGGMHPEWIDRLIEEAGKLAFHTPVPNPFHEHVHIALP
jgi:hypothetical protein